MRAIHKHCNINANIGLMNTPKGILNTNSMTNIVSSIISLIHLPPMLDCLLGLAHSILDTVHHVHK